MANIQRAVTFVVAIFMIVQPAGAIEINSPAFSAGGAIPSEFTCDGRGRNPPLVFSNVPAAARSLAIVVDDPDAPRILKADGVFVHWIRWDLPPETSGIAAGEASGGINGNGGSGWIPPCPPDAEHRYVFKLFALDTMLAGASITTSADFYRAIDGHVLERQALTARYRRPLRWFVIVAAILLTLLAVVVAVLYGGYRLVRVVLRRDPR